MEINLSFKQPIVRSIAFLVGCLGLRSLLAYSVSAFTQWKLLFSILVGSIGLGFTIIYLGGLRNVGAETGGQIIWWNSIRPIHALLYLTASYMIFREKFTTASSILYFDTFIGFIVFILHRGLKLNLFV